MANRTSSPLPRWAAALLAAAALQGHAGAPDAPVNPIERPALQAAQAAHGVMLAVSPAGPRLVAAGERGIVLWSDDRGASWHQARVPVSTTLTALSFPTPQEGWAAGHAGIVLHTRDGGQTWTRQLDGRAAAQIEARAARATGDPRRLANAEALLRDGPDKPLLAIHFWNASRGVAVGAYGLALGTEDGGRTWTSWMDRLDNPRGLHLNALHVDGERVFLAGEQGLLLRSADGGRRFTPLPSPYAGSWFSVTGRGPHVVLAGLRGHVYWSDDAGARWTAASTPMPVSINAATVTPAGRYLFANQAGLLLASDDGGRTLHPIGRTTGAPCTALAIAADGAVLAATFAGATTFPVPRLLP